MNKKRETQVPTEDQIREEDLRSRAHKLHITLFPEEYDHMFDSISDAKERRRGIKPMSTEHIAVVNERRVKLGFAPLASGSEDPKHDTYRYVLEKLRAGEEESLIATNEVREKEDAEAEHKREKQRVRLQTPVWQEKQIDEMLASDAYLDHDMNRDSPEVVAFRVLGELFKMNPFGDSEVPFLSLIRAAFPGKTKAEYKKLYRQALNEWVEAYGY